MRWIVWGAGCGLVALGACEDAPRVKPPPCDRGFSKVDTSSDGVILHDEFSVEGFEGRLISEQAEWDALVAAHPDAEAWTDHKVYPDFSDEVAFVTLERGRSYNAGLVTRACTDGDLTYVTYRYRQGTGEDLEFDVLEWDIVPRGTSTTFAWRGLYLED